MPRLPDFGSVTPARGGGRVVPVQADQTGVGLQQMGETLYRVNAERQERDARTSYSKARAQFAIEQTKMLSELQRDTDYRSFETKYEGMRRRISELGSGVTDPAYRAQFEQDAELDYTQGMARVQGLAWDREVDHENAALDKDLTVLHEAFLTEKDSAARARHLENARTRILAAQENGYLDETRAQEKSQRFAVDAAASYVEMQEPGEQLKLLGDANGVAQYIPADVRHAMAERSKNALEAERAKGLADAMIAAAGSAVVPIVGPEETIDVSAATDRALRAVESQYGKLDPSEQMQVRAYTEQRIADAERDRARNQLHNASTLRDTLDQNGGDFQAMLASGGAAIMQTLPVAEQLKINKYAGMVATGETRPTDWQAYNMLVNSPDLLKAANLGAIREKFNEADYRALLATQQKLIEEPGYEQNLRSDKAVVDSILAGSGIKKDDQKYGEFQSALQIQVNAELEATGKKKLPQGRLEQIASDLLVTKVIEEHWYGDDTRQAFEIPEAEKKKLIEALERAGKPTDPATLYHYWAMKQAVP